MFNFHNRLLDYAKLNKPALITEDTEIFYNDLIEGINNKFKYFKDKNIVSKVIILQGDFDYETITSLFALIRLHNVILIQTEQVPTEWSIKLVKADIILNPKEKLLTEFKYFDKPVLIRSLIESKNSGIMLLTSGTTGEPKAVLHSINKLFIKYKHSNKSFRTSAFLLFDHIAGLDTMFYTFSAGGTLVTLRDRSPETVIDTIKEKNIEVLPTSPSFLNMLLIFPEFSPEYLPSLKIITFGSERIMESTLEKLKNRFGDTIKIMQKYGITEMGSLQVKSNPDNPQWIKIDERYTNYKIVNDTLFLKSNSSMIGYVFIDHCEEFDGWYNTQDKVEVDGEWIKILGRTTDIINVGGQKVYPTEVESILLEMGNVKDVSVYAKDNPIMGEIVGARFSLFEKENINNLKKRVRLYCKNKMESYKIPVHIEITEEDQFTERFKKVR